MLTERPDRTVCVPFGNGLDDRRVLLQGEGLGARDTKQAGVEFEDPLQDRLAHCCVDGVTGNGGDGLVKGDVGGDEPGGVALSGLLAFE